MVNPAGLRVTSFMALTRMAFAKKNLSALIYGDQQQNYGYSISCNCTGIFIFTSK